MNWTWDKWTDSIISLLLKADTRLRVFPPSLHFDFFTPISGLFFIGFH